MIEEDSPDAGFIKLISKGISIQVLWNNSLGLKEADFLKLEEILNVVKGLSVRTIFFNLPFFLGGGLDYARWNKIFMRSVNGVSC